MIKQSATYFILFTLFFFAASEVNAQKDQYIYKAKRFANEYEDEEVVVLEESVQIEFLVDPKTELLSVTETTEWTYLGIKDNSAYFFVQFYDSSSDIEVEYILKNGRKVKIPVKDEYYNQEEYFYTDARIKYMDFNLDKGEVFQVKTIKTYTDAKYFTRCSFYEPSPLIEKVITFVIPNDVNVELKDYNFEGSEITTSSRQDSKKKARVVKYAGKDLKAFQNERNSVSSAHSLPHILVLSKSFQTKSGKQVVFEDTDDLYDWYSGLVKSMDNNPSEFKGHVESLIQGISDDKEKVRKLFYWVQDNIRYIAFEDGIAGFKPDDCQNVFQKKYGDCKGMANLLKEMLLLAGFDARLTWIGTDRIPYDYSTPSLAVDNHMICTWIYNGEKYYLDPTEQFNSLGEVSSRIQGKQVLIEDGDAFILDVVPMKDGSSNVVSVDWKLSMDGDRLVGKGTSKYSGERLVGVLHVFNKIKLDKREEAIEHLINNDDKNFIVSSVSHSDASDRDNEFTVDYELSLANQVSYFDTKAYVELDFYKEFNWFKFEERETDYLFNYKYNLANSLTIDIPAGYKATSIPEGLDIETEYFKVTTSVEQVGNAIQYDKHISIKKRRIPTSYFEDWNEEFLKLTEFYQEQVVLEKE